MNSFFPFLKNLIIPFLLFSFCTIVSAQGIAPIYRKIPEYVRKMKREADSLYRLGEYEKAAEGYKAIIVKEEKKVPASYWFDIACCYSLIGKLDSAAVYMEAIANNKYSSYAHMVAYLELQPLHQHPKWKEICDKVSENRFRKMSNPNREVIFSLDTVTIRDQSKRWVLMDIEQKYGMGSKQYKALKIEIEKDDSLNRIIVARIMEKYGWLSQDEIGEEGGIALFLVIQHASLDYQTKYYNQVKDAVARQYIHPFILCYIEDRIAVSKNELQTYGTQLGTYGKTQNYFIYPLKDPDHLDSLRTSLGLSSMADYVIDYGINWSVESYKRKLPSILKEIEKKKKL